ncbi:MAG TPA: cell division protein FtsL [Pyrinomonadaceae bacterium]|jgi:cell division protein FtsL
MRRLPLNQPNHTVRRERDRAALSRLGLLLLCGFMLTCGFVYAAGQHFAAVRYGYQTEELRRERARLLEEQRHLVLAREQATAPARLEEAAHRLGMQQAQPGQIGVARSSSSNSTAATSVPQTATAFVNPSASLHH